MFLRRNRKRSDGETYEYWTLVESVRTSRGPRQRIVATLGKLPGLDEDERAGWEEITRLLDGRARNSEQADLFRPPLIHRSGRRSTSPKFGLNVSVSSGRSIWRWPCGDGLACTAFSRRTYGRAGSGLTGPP